MKLIRVLAWICLTLGCIAIAIAQAPTITGVEAVGVTVSDLHRSVEFYTQVLHFQKEWEKELSGAEVEHFKGVFGVRVRVARLRLGSEEIELSEYLAPQGRPLPQDSRSNDLWFQHVAIVVSDMQQAYGWLREHHVQHVSSGPETLPAWNPQAGGIQAFYFRDPDGHALELIHFPAGKGDPRWQNVGSDLFLGIDHTAIAVSNTDASLVFYRDQLGMRVARASENYGDEQEHLNNVFGARLRITSLRSAHGPGIELLEYLAPRTGRRIPEDAHANDLAHWETLVDQADVNASWSYFSQNHQRLISSDVERLGNRSGFLFADPDGHVLQAVSPATTQALNVEGR
jgi:catechol 2,3-dioxygenase-like lactoylglutathione lyase family enzyme